MKTFKLPTLKEFASNKKEIDPYLKFFTWVGKQIDPAWKVNGQIKLDPSKICLHSDDEKILFELQCKWGKKVGISEKQMAWHNLSYGPSITTKKESGFVYVKAGAFKKIKNENFS